MNVRQQLYKKHRLEGYSKYTSARKAGYAHNTAIKAKQVENSIDMSFWLEKEGLTDTALAKHAEAGLNANKVISANITYGDADEKTNDFIEVPDWPSRHKYYETILKITNRLKEKAVNEINNVINVTNTAFLLSDGKERKNYEAIAEARRSNFLSSK